MSYSFVIYKIPYSYNSQNQAKKEQTKAEFLKELTKKYPNLKPLENELYGIVYYIRPRPTNLDADNLSKPIWDALNGITYKDDKQIKHRRASIIEADNFSITSDTIKYTDLKRLLKAIEKELDVLYIEIGNYTSNLIEFNIEDCI